MPHRFDKRVGWQRVKATDSTKGKMVERLSEPNRMQHVLRGGEYRYLYAPVWFGRDVFDNAGPSTEYGKTGWREDSSDGAVDYLYDCDVPRSERKLDPMRRNALGNVMREVSLGYNGPFTVTVEEVEPSRDMYAQALTSQVIAL